VNNTLERLEDARHALVDGNIANEPVPPEIIARWLDYIAGNDEHDPCTLCGLRQLEHCQFACAQRCPECGGPLSYGDGEIMPPVYCDYCSIGWDHPPFGQSGASWCR
jgi:hypothetical protein